MSDNNQWDLVIKPRRGVFYLGLLDLWENRELLVMFVVRDFKAFYKQTVLGPIWFFIQPIFTTLVFTFVFGNLAGLSTDGVPQPLFYLTGTIVWSFFSQTLLKSSSVLRDSAGIFGKVYFPRLIMPLSVVASSLLKLIVQILLFAVVLTYFIISGYEWQISPRILLFPILVILAAIQAMGFGLIITSLTIKYRDFALLLTFGMQLLMYATTVVYPLSSLSGTTQLVISFVPTTYILEGIRWALLGSGTFDAFGFFYLITVSGVILFLGMINFNRVERAFVDTV